MFSVGRKPNQPYASFASMRRLDGVRIGVIREYMSKKLFSKADEESIDIVERAIGDLRKLGATIVDPGPEGALFQSCIREVCAGTAEFDIRSNPNYVQPTRGSTGNLLDMHADPSRAPTDLSLRTLNGGQRSG